MAHLLNSKGDISELHKTLEYYKDWRDLLIKTGLANEDWIDVLKNLGIDYSET
ncbi:MAG: hypothetical protein OCD01_05275 [Fibrobacterales bacterium]